MIWFYAGAVSAVNNWESREGHREIVFEILPQCVDWGEHGSTTE